MARPKIFRKPVVLPIYTEETAAKRFRALAKRLKLMPGKLFALLVRGADARIKDAAKHEA